MDPTALTYLEHLTPADLALLGSPPPERIGERLSHPDTHEAVFGREASVMVASPFLTFAVAIHRTVEELGASTFTREWVAPRQRVPVFDAHVLRDFAADPVRRLFLVELLASYTHVVSGSMWVHTGRGWRRRRFSELDPVRLASLLEVVDQRERPGVYRRLGDLALFLTGVFPDHTAAQGFGAVGRSRLLRAGGFAGGADENDEDDVSLLEQLGARWYRLAVRQMRGPLTGTMRAASEAAERFQDARRVLNFVTDRFLFPFRSRWFGVSGA